MLLVKTLLEVGGVLAAITLLLVLSWFMERRMEPTMDLSDLSVGGQVDVDEIAIDTAAAA